MIITVDALRPDLGFLGYARNVSPNLDAFAKQSAVFEKTYATSTYTGFCLPPLMASRYPSEMPRDNRHEVHYAPANVFLAERMREAGFHTAGARIAFLVCPRARMDRRVRTLLTRPARGHRAPRIARRPVSFFARPRRRHHFASQRFAADARSFLHLGALSRPSQAVPRSPGYSTFGTAPRDKYDGEIAYTDAHIGRLLQELDGSPLGARTVVILTGDHGEAFGEHGEYFHGAEIWDEVVRVPLVIRVPGKAPRRISTRVSHVDIAPTVLELAGLPPDKAHVDAAWSPHCQAVRSTNDR